MAQTDRLTPVFEAMQANLSAREQPASTRSQAVLRVFEDWDRQEAGTKFYALLDRYTEPLRVDV